LTKKSAKSVFAQLIFRSTALSPTASWRANTSARKLKRSAFVDAIINEIPIINFTTETARIHAEIYGNLAHRGQLIGAHDLMIAATAIACGHALLTAKQGEFIRVPGLEVLEFQIN
jgi:predicted nucleic acid-binding protein